MKGGVSAKIWRLEDGKYSTIWEILSTKELVENHHRRKYMERDNCEKNILSLNLLLTQLGIRGNQLSNASTHRKSLT
jgi:hypothetical protein